MDKSQERLVVVSNRLPFVFKRDSSHKWRVEPGSGGLITALVPVLKKLGGTWIGWPGTSGPVDELDQALETAGADLGYALKPVHLSNQEIHDFYHGFSNEIVWPLFHDLQTVCNFDPAYWKTYCEVNRKFAQSIAANSRSGDFIWVHDYHLINVAAELRALGSTARTAFFLHIPFPSLDLFSKLPWCKQLLEALLQFDLIGFQTAHDRRNFEQCARAIAGDVAFEGHGKVVRADVGGRRVAVGTFPISIDFKSFACGAATPQVRTRARELRNMLKDRKLVLGVDRLDYTKGIPHRLRAFHHLLTRHPQLREKISLIQVVVPSRQNIPEYDALKTSIDQLVGRINGEFAKPGGWVPVWYVYDSLTPEELLAYYRAADIALVTPLRDGMNLVAKEYCAADVGEDHVLVLSEFAGAAAQLREGALLVNPYDTDGVAQALRRACEMGPEERRLRMRSLRRSVRKFDVFRWVDGFMNATARDMPLVTQHVRLPAAPVRTPLPHSPILLDSAARAMTVRDAV
jgi:trehalose 6-phosphate synthase